MQDLIVSIVAHLHGIPLVARHHLLPLVLWYIWKGKSFIVSYQLILYLPLQVSTYMHWHPWHRDRRWWGNCGYSRHPARSTCSQFAPWCVSDSPEIYKLQNETGEAISVYRYREDAIKKIQLQADSLKKMWHQQVSILSKNYTYIYIDISTAIYRWLSANISNGATWDTYYGDGLNQLKELNEFEGDDDNKSIMSTSYTNTFGLRMSACVCVYMCEWQSNVYSAHKVQSPVKLDSADNREQPHYCI